MTVRLSFGEIPIMLAGILFGPFAGALTGIAADLLGYMINSAGLAYFPGFTLSAALIGFIPGLLLKNSEKELTLWRLCGLFLSQKVVSVVLTLRLTIVYSRWAICQPVQQGFLFPAYTIAFIITNRSFIVALRERQA